MEQMAIFTNPEFGRVRTIEENGEILFCGTDIARSLGYGNPRRAVRDHCEDGQKRSTPTESGEQSMYFIPESDVYNLIIRSKLPAAKQFRNWIFKEVLPSIRKTGGYGDQRIDKVLQQVEVATQMMAHVAETMAAIAQQMVQQPREEPDTITLVEPSLRIKRHSIISHLDTELRQEVEEMICSQKFTYSDIVQHLAGYGVKLSMASICRYAKLLG